MQQEKLKIYGYRWVVLLAFMAVIFVNQMLWITFASITGPAARFYGVSDLAIAFLSLSFMLVYIVRLDPRLVGHRHLRDSRRGGDRRGVDRRIRADAGPAGGGLHHGADRADRDRRGPAVPAECDHQGRCPLVSAGGSRDRLRAGHAQHVRRAGCGAGPDAPALARPGPARDADGLRRDRGRGRGRVPDLRPGAPADAGLARR